MDGQANGTHALDGVTADDEPTVNLPAEPSGEQFLLFWVGEWPCLAPIAELREALPHVPHHVALPFSPRWLWGIFPLRTDIVALIDPAPMLTHGPEAARTQDTVRRLVATPVGAYGQVEPWRALVVGESDHLVALLADRIGEICALGEEDQRPLDLSGEWGTAPLPRYVTQGYAVNGLERPALALSIARLVEDVFAALEERPDHE